ncbi:dihydrodipicolinate reductase [Chloroflexia bacterium SDU3-3]|nr:dihydrodipicolinate reductase [Chloroflexia bacterium SDU3-3]
MATRIICYGLGPIGLGIAKLARTRTNIEIVGAVDVDPSKVGRDLGEVLGGEKIGVTITDSITKLADLNADVVLHATGSALARVASQFTEIMSIGANIVSTCEELSYPWTAQPALAAELDAAARKAGVTLIGTGVNPGYAMDALPLMLTAPCASVDSVRVLRVVDAARRRGPLQKKVGAGLTPEQFAEQVKAGTVRHVGLPESLHMLATSLGWELSRTEDVIQPMIADAAITTEFAHVEPGQVAGVHQIARGFCGDREVINLELRMYLGAPDAQDTVEIAGNPPVKMTIQGGLHGDVATAAMVVNTITSVLRAAPGLASMADAPMAHYW